MKERRDDSALTFDQKLHDNYSTKTNPGTQDLGSHLEVKEVRKIMRAYYYGSNG